MRERCNDSTCYTSQDSFVNDAKYTKGQVSRGGARGVPAGFRLLMPISVDVGFIFWYGDPQTKSI